MSRHAHFCCSDDDLFSVWLHMAAFSIYFRLYQCTLVCRPPAATRLLVELLEMTLFLLTYRYGILLLVVECMGASTVVLYGVWLLYSPVQEDFVEDPHTPGLPKVHIHPRCTFRCEPDCICCS